jgi:hypothetical protein
MDTTTQHSADASAAWIAQMRTGAIALAVIVASMAAWAVILATALTAHR